MKILSDGWTAVTRDRSLSAQFEHTVGVTETGVEVFTLSPDGSGPAALRRRHDGHETAPPDAASRIISAIASGCASASARPAPTRSRLRAARAASCSAPIPRRDTKPLAKALIARFGPSPRCSPRRRRGCAEVDGVGEARRSPSSRSSRRRRALRASGAVRKRPALSLLERGARLLPRRDGASRDREQFRMLFLDKQEPPDRRRGAGRGTVDHTPVYPREVVKRALELSATRHHPGAQPPLRRPDAVARRHRDDAEHHRDRQAARHRRCTTTSSSAAGPRQPESDEFHVTALCRGACSCMGSPPAFRQSRPGAFKRLPAT